MKKAVCIILSLSLWGFTFAKGGGRKFVASLDNEQVVKSRKDAKRQTKEFATGRRFTAVTHNHGLHLFRHRGGASRPESGLGL